MTWVVRKNQPHDVYIGRPSKWGNPFIIGLHGNRSQVIKLYQLWLDGLVKAPDNSKPPSHVEIRQELKEKILGCHCKPKKCHGDILALIANASSNTLWGK